MIMYFNVLETEEDREICQKLYEENRQRLFRIANKILQNSADAEDAVQICFSKVMCNFACYRKMPYEELVILCQTIVKHDAIDIIREHKKTVNFTDEFYLGEDNVASLAPDILDRLVEKYENGLIVQAIMELGEEERELMYLQYVSGLKPREIAKLLDTTSSVIRKRTLRCRNKLAEALKGYEWRGYGNESLQ